MSETVAPRKPAPEVIDIERREGLLDELNLPPKLARFIRQNARNLQIGAGVLFVLACLWSYYDYYTINRQNEAAHSLALALRDDDSESRLAGLARVVEDYSGTGAAVWSRLEEGNAAFKDGLYAEALAVYAAVEKELPSASPLRPVIYYLLALAHENAGEFEPALKSYSELAEYQAFRIVALPAQGRIHERLGNQADALKIYEEAAKIEGISGETKTLLNEKITSLKVASGSAG